MKKNALIFTISVGLIFLECKSGKKDSNNKEDSIQNTTNKDTKNEKSGIMQVQLNVKQDVYSSKEKNLLITYTVVNGSEYPIQFGTDFSIEKKNDKDWIKQPFTESLGSEDIIYGLDPKESKDFQISPLKLLKNKELSSGTYRITKTVWEAHKKDEAGIISGLFEIK